VRCHRSFSRTAAVDGIIGIGLVADALTGEVDPTLWITRDRVGDDYPLRAYVLTGGVADFGAFV